MLIPPLSYCTTKQYYSSYSLLPWAITTAGSSFHRISLARTQLQLPLELFPLRSPLLRKSMFVSSPVLTDMLKFRTYSCVSASFQPRRMHGAYRIRYVGLRPENLSIPYMGYCCSLSLSAAQQPVGFFPTVRQNFHFCNCLCLCRGGILSSQG